ncbi:MAG: hypothetical protein ACLGI2_16555 [Acidimicrobiia bacterium]
MRIEVTEEPVRGEIGPELRKALLGHAVVKSRYPEADLWLVGLDVLDKGSGEGEEANSPFRAVLTNMAGSEVVEAEGHLWELDNLSIIPTSRQRLPNDEEYAWAVDILRRDPALAARIDAGEVEPYRPLPPLGSVIDADGSVVRAVAVGLREPGAGGGGARHRVVAVRSSDGEVLTEGPGLLGGVDRECGLPDGPAESTPDPADGAQQARVRVWRGEELLWDLVVVRPAGSSGSNGSGVELRLVDFQGVRAIHRAHVPIVNVAFDGGAASRNWLNEESAFEAEGDEPLPGFRVCTSAPRTIAERGEGGGNFRGVAVWLDGEELVVLSQVQAGWYRYVSEWRLGPDGTIRPRLSAGAVRNPVTCDPHTHHAYWRLDFDLVGPEQNQVQERNDPTLPGQLAPWHTIRYESQRRREAGRERTWRVRTVKSPHGYAIVAGPGDGTADEFGAGDLWVLVQHPEEFDDGEGFTTDPARARAQLDRFVSGELVEREDVVVWYAAHARQEGGGSGGLTTMGPELQPFNWRARVEREPYGMLEPPVHDRDDDDDDYDDDEDDDDE